MYVTAFRTDRARRAAIQELVIHEGSPGGMELDVMNPEIVRAAELALQRLALNVDPGGFGRFT